MEEMKVQPEEQELDLLEMFCVLWHRAWLLLLSLVVGAALAGAATYLVGMATYTPPAPFTPVYRATSTICGFSANANAESYLLELELFNSLVVDLRTLGASREVVENALEAAGIEMSYEDVVGSGSIWVTNPADTHILQINVNNGDPELAAQLCNAVADQLKLKVAEVMGIDVPATASRAVVPTKPANSPSTTDPIPENLMRNCILGGLIFFVLAAGAVLLVYFLGESFKEKMAMIRGKQRDRK